jgi:thiol-disulfide isomerase/thioredoxin
MNQLIKTSIDNAISYQEYSNLIKKIVSEKKTTGNEQTQERIEYTKLNSSRMRRVNKTITLTTETINIFNNVRKQTWLILCESWCGDAAHTLPVLNKIAENSNNIDLKIVLRDNNLDLMNTFLTNGSQAIPKLIMVDENYCLINVWGARSSAATQLVVDYKQEFGSIDAKFKKDLQVWYNNDKGISIVSDLVKLVKRSTICTE